MVKSTKLKSVPETRHKEAETRFSLSCTDIGNSHGGAQTLAAQNTPMQI
jgi:hypothetical protein